MRQKAEAKGFCDQRVSVLDATCHIAQQTSFADPAQTQKDKQLHFNFGCYLENLGGREGGGGCTDGFPSHQVRAALCVFFSIVDLDF